MDDIFTLYYDIGINRFENDNGEIVHRIYELVPPREIYMFKHEKCNRRYWNSELQKTIELIYPLTQAEIEAYKEAQLRDRKWYIL